MLIVVISLHCLVRMSAWYTR